MNDQMLNEGFRYERMLQLTAWLEWMQPFLHCLLALAVVSLLLTLLDLAMLSWKEFHHADAQARTKAAFKSDPEASLQKQSYYAIKVLFLLAITN